MEQATLGCAATSVNKSHNAGQVRWIVPGTNGNIFLAPLAGQDVSPAVSCQRIISIQHSGSGGWVLTHSHIKKGAILQTVRFEIPELAQAGLGRMEQRRMERVSDDIRLSYP